MSNPITTSATRLRTFLFVAMGLAVIAIIAMVVFGVRYLDTYAADVNETVYESTTSNERLAVIRQQVDTLEKNSSAAERAKQIVAESQSYLYQDVIIRDLHNFAQRAGIQITNFDFVSTESSETGAAASEAPAAAADPAADPAAEAGAAGEMASPAQPAPQLKSTTVNITLENPVDYRRMLQFIHYIEQNLTKMQISSVSLSGSTEDSSTVTTDALTIEVYIR